MPIAAKDWVLILPEASLCKGVGHPLLAKVGQVDAGNTVWVSVLGFTPCNVHLVPRHHVVPVGEIERLRAEGVL